MTKEKHIKISLTGELGSGKSTLTKLLSARLGAEVVSIGTMQRQLGSEMGMTVLEFNEYMETHTELDKRVDDMLKSYDELDDKNYLFDSRLAWHFVPSSFSIYVTVDPLVAAVRVRRANRETEQYASDEEAEKKLAERKDSEYARYSWLYGVDLTNMDNYSLVIDSTSETPENMMAAVLENYGLYSEGKARPRALLCPRRMLPANRSEEGGETVVTMQRGMIYVVSGLAAVRAAAKEGEGLIACKLINAKAQTSAALVSEWEKECGFKFITKPRF